jgi:hypothetical protein
VGQVAKLVMLAWGRANRSKEELAKRDARKGVFGALLPQADGNPPTMA